MLVVFVVTRVVGIQQVFVNEQQEYYPWIDTHAHMESNTVTLGKVSRDLCTSVSCLEEFERVLQHHHVEKTIVMSPPRAREPNEEAEDDLLHASTTSEAFDYGGGGAVLNPMLQEAYRAGIVSSELRSNFELAAKKIAANGAAVFGEIAGLHLSAGPSHPFEQIPLDHELMLLLADIAAAEGIPMDIHLDLIPTNQPTPTFFLQRSERNPTELESNLESFERLLEHNRNARIVLAHVGWDMVGTQSFELYDRLLSRHDNLFLQIRVSTSLFSEHGVLDKNGVVREEWLDFLEKYQNRFVLGTDMFYGDSELDTRSLELTNVFLDQLPKSIVTAIATENAKVIYRLSN